MIKFGAQRIFCVLGDKPLVLYYPSPKPFILCDVVQRHQNAQNWIEKFHCKFEKKPHKNTQSFLTDNKWTFMNFLGCKRRYLWISTKFLETTQDISAGRRWEWFFASPLLLPSKLLILVWQDEQMSFFFSSLLLFKEQTLLYLLTPFHRLPRR